MACITPNRRNGRKLPTHLGLRLILLRRTNRLSLGRTRQWRWYSATLRAPVFAQVGLTMAFVTHSAPVHCVSRLSAKAQSRLHVRDRILPSCSAPLIASMKRLR